MSSDDLPFTLPTEDFEASLTSAQLNATIIFTFLSGIYSLLYSGTIYLHISRLPKQARNITVLSALSLLYALCMAQLGIQWYYTISVFILSGDSRLSMFIAAIDRGSTAGFVVFQTTFCLMFIISDALLIWRCYHVWGRSFRIIALPLLLLLAETGLSIALSVLSPAQSFSAVPITFKNITGPQAFVSFGTTALCTVLIGYKIHSTNTAVSGSGGIKASRSPLNHIIKVIVESAALYSLVLLVYAIQATIPIPISSLLHSPLLVEGYYFQPITVAIAGMSPTIIAARIALTYGPKTTEVYSNHSQDSGGSFPRQGMNFQRQLGTSMLDMYDNESG